MGFQDDFARTLKERRSDGDADASLGQGVEGKPLPSTDGDGVEASSPSHAGHPSPTSRHDGWTPEVRVKFLEALANCGNISSAAAFVQMSRTSAYNLKRRDVNFSRGWDSAVLLARDVATDFLQDRAINGIEEDVYYQGEVVGSRQRYDSRLLLAHIARLDKLAERMSVSRGAARFGEMLDAIAGEEDTTLLITEPTTDEITGIIAEAEAQATVRQVEAACLRQNNEAAAAELSTDDGPSAELWAAADINYGPMHEVDWGDGTALDYSRMTEADATKLCADHPPVKTRRVERDDPAFVAAIVAPNAAASAIRNGE